MKNTITAPFFAASAENSNAPSGLHRANSDLEKAWAALTDKKMSVNAEGTCAYVYLPKLDPLAAQILLQSIAVAIDSRNKSLQDLLQTKHGSAGYLTAGSQKMSEFVGDLPTRKLEKLSFAAFRDATKKHNLLVGARDSYVSKTGKIVNKDCINITIYARALDYTQLEFLAEWGIDMLEPNRLLLIRREDTTTTYIVSKPRSLEIENI